MKIPTATALSALGVIAAGGIAFAVNTSVLDSATATSSYAPAVQAAVIPIAADTTPIVASGDPVTDVSSAPTTAVPAAPTAMATAYDVAGFGVVSIDQTVDSLIVTAVQPLAGVTYEIEQESPSRIEVEFRAPSGQAVEFRAALVSGRVVTSVVNHTERYQSADRDDDRDHEDDDHEDGRDDEHEEDDHDDD